MESKNTSNAHRPPSCAERRQKGGKAFGRACEPFVLPLRVPRTLRYSVATASKKKSCFTRLIMHSQPFSGIVGTGILKFKICLWPLSVCYNAFVGWKIVARGRFSRVGLSRFDARLTRPTKGFAPFWRPLGARGGPNIET